VKTARLAGRLGSMAGMLRRCDASGPSSGFGMRAINVTISCLTRCLTATAVCPNVGHLQATDRPVLLQSEGNGVKKVKVRHFSVGSLLLNELMTLVMDFVQPRPIMKQKLYQVNFHTTLSGEGKPHCLHAHVGQKLFNKKCLRICKHVMS